MRTSRRRAVAAFGLLAFLAIGSPVAATVDSQTVDSPGVDSPPERAAPAVRAGIPKPPRVARTTIVPPCTVHVDDAAGGGGSGTAAAPFASIGEAVDAAPTGGVICVAEGEYREALAPGAKPLTLAGGFQSGSGFDVRDSARYVTRAVGDGSGSFVRIEDPAPSGDQLTAVDGFDISGYSQAIVRQSYYSQRFDVTNNFIHDNTCDADGLAGAGFALNNVSGTIRGNVFVDNSCWRGGAGALDDTTNENSVSVIANRVVRNAGTEPDFGHGGALYLFTNRLTVSGNLFSRNTVTAWGAGLYVGAYPSGGQETTARLSWNVYERNSAGIAGGGMFCDDGAHCSGDHEVFDANCGGNLLFDSGFASPTTGAYDHMTNVRAKAVGCRGKGIGVQIDAADDPLDSYSFTNSIIWGNAKRLDLVAGCSGTCDRVTVTVSYSMLRRPEGGLGIPIDFGPGIVRSRNPRFVAIARRDFHLQSVFGHWTRQGYVPDQVSSPALAKGDPASPTPDNPDRAGVRTELGAYGNSKEASYVE